MEWISSLADGDVVLARETGGDGLRIVVYGRRGAQFICRTYAEAELRALAYAEHAHASVWYSDALGLQLIGSFVRVGVPSPPVAGSD